jgi:hypothetical protein
MERKYVEDLGMDGRMIWLARNALFSAEIIFCLAHQYFVKSYSAHMASHLRLQFDAEVFEDSPLW